jgi:hypothetical protein
MAAPSPKLTFRPLLRVRNACLCLKELPLLASLFTVVCTLAKTYAFHLLHLRLRYLGCCPIR